MTSKYAKVKAEDFGLLQAITQRIVVSLYLTYYLFRGVKVLGKENIPKEGNFIAAANHISFSDPPLLASIFDKPVAFMAKDGLFKTPITAAIFKSLGCIAVNRDKLEIATIRSAKEILKAGWALGIFPEGTRITTKSLGKVNRGFAFLAKATQRDVLPVAIIGTNEKKGPIVVKIGKLLSTEAEGDNLVNAWVTAISEMTGRSPYAEEAQEPQALEV